MTRKPQTRKSAKSRRKPVAPAPEDKKLEHVFDDPKNVKRAIQVLFAVCGIVFVLDFIVHRHVDHPWEAFIGFYAVYGFVACVLLVLAAKAMRTVLMRKDEYYDE
jgi:hypothetical protein